MKRPTLSGAWEAEIQSPFYNYSLIRGGEKKKLFSFFERVHEENLEDPFGCHTDAGILKGNFRIVEGPSAGPSMNLATCFANNNFVVRVCNRIYVIVLIPS